MLENMLILNSWVATAVLVFEIATLGKLSSLIIVSLDKENSFRKKFIHTVYGTKQNIFQKFGLDVLSDKFLLIFIFLFSLFASLMTLVYSEIFLQVPCALCWFERIFMYGIVIISATALWSNRELEQKGILKYITNFSVLGALVSLYHHILQMAASFGSHLPCPTSGGDCGKRIIFEYGHVTFPWMAFVLFAFFIIIILLQRKLKVVQY
jgi:disulfide bond formation protein DsbB